MRQSVAGRRLGVRTRPVGMCQDRGYRRQRAAPASGAGATDRKTRTDAFHRRAALQRQSGPEGAAAKHA